MRRILIGTIIALSFIALTYSTLTSQAPDGIQPPPGMRIVKSEKDGTNQRALFAPQASPPRGPDSPAISFIDSPTASCVQPDPAQNACYINWYYMNVDAGTSAYMITMTATINPNVRARYYGFFQQTMYVPFNMQPTGFKVLCGSPPGNYYAWTILARASDGLGSANYGTVQCPPYQP